MRGGFLYMVSRNERSPHKQGKKMSTQNFQELWLDRDLSWLEFNRRVLAEALDERTPLLERAKFLAIFSSNLDEFFMKRIAVLREHLTPERVQIIADVRAKLQPLLTQQADYFLHEIVPGLSQHGIHLRRWDEL